MPDFIKLKVSLGSDFCTTLNSEMPFEYNGFRFTPCHLSEIIAYEHKSMGFRLKIINSTLYAEGSLHKFSERSLHKNNHTDFPFSEVCKAINEFAKHFNIDANEAIITTLESGVNITLDENPIEYINSISSYKLKKKFNPMTTSKPPKLYGKKCVLSQYDIKVYDKTLQTKSKLKIELPKQILRIEIVYRKSQLFSRRINTLSDLKNKENFEWLKNDLQNKVNHINFKSTSIDTSILNSKERESYFAGINPEYWIEESLYNKKGVHNLKANYKRVKRLAENVESNLHAIPILFKEIICRKIEELIKN